MSGLYGVYASIKGSIDAGLGESRSASECELGKAPKCGVINRGHLRRTDHLTQVPGSSMLSQKPLRKMFSAVSGPMLSSSALRNEGSLVVYLCCC